MSSSNLNSNGPIDRKKSLLKLRYDLIRAGFDRKFFRIRDLKLFYYGNEINDKEPFDSISNFLGTIDTNNDENLGTIDTNNDENKTDSNLIPNAFY